MNILHIFHRYYPARGGVEDFMHDLAVFQVGIGHKVTVLAAGNMNKLVEYQDEGVHVIQSAVPFEYHTPISPFWVKYLRQQSFDIIHLHLPCPLGEWALLLTNNRSRLIVSFHNAYSRPWFFSLLQSQLSKLIFRKAAAILIGSEDYAESCQILLRFRAKWRIVPYGVDLGYSQQFTGIDNERKGVLFAGRLVYYKGLDTLLEAVPDFYEDLTIVGKGVLETHLINKIQEHGLSNKIHLTGFLAEDALYRKMAEAKVFVFPSTHVSESYGISQLKAMSMGLPVVSSDLPGVRWLNRDGETGYVVPTQSPSALAGAVNRILGNDTLRQEMSQRAGLRASHFPIDKMRRDIEAIYEGQ